MTLSLPIQKTAKASPEEEEEEWDLSVPPVSTGVPSSSPDEAFIPALPSLPDDYKQFQELLRRVADTLQISLEEIQETSHRLLNILQSV